MIEIPNKIEKAWLADKPRVTFDGIIEEIDTEEKAEKAMAVLSREKIVGFDTETRPSFTRGLVHKIALLQLSTDTCAYLIRLNRIGIPDCVAAFLSDPDWSSSPATGAARRKWSVWLRWRRSTTPTIPRICATREPIFWRRSMNS